MGFTTYNTVNYKYYSHQYDGGQHCDENNKPRRTEVRYIACTSSQAVRPSLLGDFIDLCGLRYRGEDLRIRHHRLHSRSQEGRILQDYRDQSCEAYGTLWVPHVIGTIVSDEFYLFPTNNIILEHDGVLKPIQGLESYEYDAMSESQEAPEPLEPPSAEVLEQETEL